MRALQVNRLEGLHLLARVAKDTQLTLLPVDAPYATWTARKRYVACKVPAPAERSRVPCRNAR